MTDRTDGMPERKPRCLRLVADKHGVNRCQNEQLGDAEMCLRHLREAADWWTSIVAQAVDQFPALRGIIGKETAT